MHSKLETHFQIIFQKPYNVDFIFTRIEISMEYTIMEGELGGYKTYTIMRDPFKVPLEVR